MTRWLAVGAASIAMVTISAVLFWGTTGRAGTPAFEAAVMVLGIATPSASMLLTWHCWHARHRSGAVLSSTPLLIMIAGFSFGLAGRPLSLPMLLWLDFLVLVVFAAVLGWCGRALLGAADGAARCGPPSES